MKTICTAFAPLPGGHYAQAVVQGDLVYVSGQLPIRPDGSHAKGTVGEQTEQAMGNLAAILQAAGSSLGQVLKVTIYVSDVTYWPAVNAAYARLMGDARPARSIVPTAGLHFGFAVEIDAIAVVPEARP